MKTYLAPSILAADFKNLEKQIQIIEENGAHYVHFDVMDGVFVENISFGIPVLESIRSCTNLVKDVHLMVQEPIRYVEAFQKAGADIITVHLEACEDIERTIEKIREVGCKVGVAINPSTPTKPVELLLDKIDMVLVMSVKPGKGGQEFIEESLDKIRRMRLLIEEYNLDVDVEVDGGINKETARYAMCTGANVVVAGSAIFNGDIAKNTREMARLTKFYELSVLQRCEQMDTFFKEDTDEKDE